MPDPDLLQSALEDAVTAFDQTLQTYHPKMATHEVGLIQSVGQGIASVLGLPNVQLNELIRFPAGGLGIAFNLDADAVGVILLNDDSHLQAGDEVYRTGKVVDVPVGEGLLGRIVDAAGRPLDGEGALETGDRFPIERGAPPVMDRAPVKVPLQTGIKVVDAIIPIGRGQRELIVGDRQTGKTAIAIDTILNQRDQDVICIYCAVGKRTSAVANVISELSDRDALHYCIVVVATGEDPPGLRYITPYAAMAIGEYFMEQGRDVLLVMDDLTRHAWAYRELSLLLRRPPGREAYPGDIFYLHSRLLERSTHLRQELGGGSLTALPIVETQAQNISAYIPTNLVSITDGQIYLSPNLFQQSILPAVDVGKSVSRVGGKTQLPAYQGLAGDLRLSYSQFQEVEVFARFGTQLDEETRHTLERGRRVREVLKQPQFQPRTVPEQIAIFLAVNQGLFDDLPLERVGEAEDRVRHTMRKELPELGDRITAGEELSDDDRQTMERTFRKALKALHPEDSEQESEAETHEALQHPEDAYTADEEPFQEDDHAQR